MSDFTLTFRNAPNVQITILEINYQRNGILGSGFHVLRFLEETSGSTTRVLIAILFEEQGCCAVLDDRDLNAHFRGDVFEPELRKITAKWDDAR